MKKCVILFVGVMAGLATLAQTLYFVQAEGNLSIIPKADYSTQYANEFSSVPSYTDMKADLAFDARLGVGLKAGARFTIAPEMVSGWAAQLFADPVQAV